MPETTPPVLPDCLIPDWDINHALQERHAELQRISLEDYRSSMPTDVRQSAEGLHFVDTFAHDPTSVEDEKSAVIVPIPFATGWRPHMAARVDLLNAALGGGQRMIALPNSVHGAPATQYTRKVMRAQNSTVTPKQPYERVVGLLQGYLGDRVQSVEIPDYGHEFGDHSVALALVEARALAKAS